MAQDHAHWKILLRKGGPSKGRDRPTEEPRKVFPGLGCLSGALKGGRISTGGKGGMPGQGPSMDKSVEGEGRGGAQGPQVDPGRREEGLDSAQAWSLAQLCLCPCQQPLAIPQGQGFPRNWRVTLCVEFCPNL